MDAIFLLSVGRAKVKGEKREGERSEGKGEERAKG